MKDIIGRLRNKLDHQNKYLRATYYLSAFTVFCGLLGVIFLFFLSFTLPDVEQLADYEPPINSKILTKDGKVLLEVGHEAREIAQFEEIPTRIVNAFLSSEDDKFYEHNGVDLIGFTRAMLKNIAAMKLVQGGSTITQQVAKQLLLTREKSIIRKLKDMMLAVKIEKQYSKEEILFLYLNQVYLGGGFYGVKAAFSGYFDKQLEDATIAEAALIAGLLVAPSYCSPYSNSQCSRKRQKYVLERMFDTGKITQAEYDLALAEEIKVRIKPPRSIKAGFFTDWVKRRVEELVGEKEFFEGGYKVVTTLNGDLQEVAEKEILEGVKSIDKRQGFKGPIGYLENPEKIKETEMTIRKEIFREASNFFTLDQEGNRIYEIEHDEELHAKLEDERKKSIKEVKKLKPYEIGNVNEDPLIPLLKINKEYKAIVTGVNNYQRMIYVSIGGVQGIIPYENFRWAHERVISDSNQYFTLVTKPSSIVKPGDQVLVNVKKLKTTAYQNYVTNYKNQIKDKEIRKILWQQKFVLCELDQNPEVEAALIAMDPRSGNILSFAGGKNFSDSQFNRAIQSLRQPGSAFKPLLYAAALENGYTPATVLIDAPESLASMHENLNWKPRNYDGKFKGPITFRKSLETSRNVPTIKIAADLGVETIVNYVERIKLNAKLDKDLSLSLGSFGVTLMDMVRTYSIFPNGGKVVYPKTIISIIGRDGKEVDMGDIDKWLSPGDEEAADTEAAKEEKTAEVVEVAETVPTPAPDGAPPAEDEINKFLTDLDEEQVYDRRLAFIMTKLLQGVVHSGTGRRAKSISNFLGGKTGTTNNYVDAWFIGFSSNVSLGVWTGFDDNNTLGWGETGAKSALPIWKAYMGKALEKYGEYDFQMPSGIVNVMINKETGKIAKDGSSTKVFMESFVEGTEPGTAKEEITEEGLKKIDILEDDDYYVNQ